MNIQNLIDYLNTLPKDSKIAINTNRGEYDPYLNSWPDTVKESLNRELMNYDKINEVLVFNP